MILIDYSQISTAAFAAMSANLSGEIDYSIESLRHMILNSIRYCKSRHGKEYGDVVIAVDMPNSWRKQMFPYYKAKRKIEHDKQTTIDWELLRKLCKEVLIEIEENLPYHVIYAKGAEADDVIGVLARDAIERTELTLIYSGDKDFIQLQTGTIWVRQYCPRRDMFLTDPDPRRLLFEHVCKGDRGDGIPNILSPQDILINNIGPDGKKTRQKPVTQKKLDQWWDDPSEIIGLPRFKENINLIDLKRTPKDIQAAIRERFATYKTNPRSGLLSYFVKHGLRQLGKQVNEF